MLECERRKKIADLYVAGVSTNGLKQRFGINSLVLYAILDEFDVPRRRPRDIKP